MADFLLEGEDADVLLQTSQGDVQGTGILGLAEDAVQAGLQEFQFFQEVKGLGLFVVAFLDYHLMLEMFDMAAEGRGTDVIGGGQGAVGHGIDQGAIDLRAGGVMTDGTAGRLMGGAVMFRHCSTPLS